MKLLDILLGRTRPVKSKLEGLFAISTAYLTLTVDVGLAPSGRAGVCFRRLSSTRFRKAQEVLEEFVDVAAAASQTGVSFETDAYSFQWVLLEDRDFEDLVATMHMVSLTLQDHGFGEQLLAGVFKFMQDGQPVYWIYNYKRGNFYPMVPGPGERERDNAAELRLRSLLEQELPFEENTRLWYPLWGNPV